MILIQLLLPLTDDEGKPLPRLLYTTVRDELVGRFGGLTTYSRAPATGLWSEEGGRTVRDELVVYEVAIQTLDRGWWRGYLDRLEQDFGQQRLHVRAMPMELL